MLPLAPTLPAPTAEPTLMRISDEGLYSIALPNVTDSGNEAGGSGETVSDAMTGDGQNRVVYLVRVHQFNNDTFFPVVSCAHEHHDYIDTMMVCLPTQFSSLGIQVSHSFCACVFVLSGSSVLGLGSHLLFLSDQLS